MLKIFFLVFLLLVIFVHFWFLVCLVKESKLAKKEEKARKEEKKYKQELEFFLSADEDTQYELAKLHFGISDEQDSFLQELNADGACMGLPPIGRSPKVKIPKETGFFRRLWQRLEFGK